MDFQLLLTSSSTETGDFIANFCHIAAPWVVIDWLSSSLSFFGGEKEKKEWKKNLAGLSNQNQIETTRCFCVYTVSLCLPRGWLFAGILLRFYVQVYVNFIPFFYSYILFLLQFNEYINYKKEREMSHELSINKCLSIYKTSFGGDSVAYSVDSLWNCSSSPVSHTSQCQCRQSSPPKNASILSSVFSPLNETFYDPSHHITQILRWLNT